MKMKNGLLGAKNTTLWTTKAIFLLIPAFEQGGKPHLYDSEDGFLHNISGHF